MTIKVKEKKKTINKSKVKRLQVLDQITADARSRAKGYVKGYDVGRGAE